MRFTRALLHRLVLFLGLFASANAFAQVNVLTQHNDIGRTGQNVNETILTPANVSSPSFGKLFSVPVDGSVYAQPLYISGLTLADGTTHNVVFVVTEADSVFAFDADTSGAPLWQVTLLDSAHGAAAGAAIDPASDLGCGDVVGSGWGITGTPVIDATSGTMYVVSRTYENNYPVQRLHALNITNGAEQTYSPVTLAAAVPGTGAGSSNGVIQFDPKWENQRTGLLLVNGIVYVAFASFCDYGPYHGWVLAYNENTLQQTSALNVTPNGTGSGIWQSGAGLAADIPVGSPFGRMFLVTGNGTYDATVPYTTNAADYGDDVVRLDLTNGVMTVTDAFTPYNQAALSSGDKDLSSGGVMVLPTGSTAYPNQLLAGGKQGLIYVLNRDNLGGYNSTGTTDNDIESINEGFGLFSIPAYWNQNVYYWPIYANLIQYQFTGGLMNTTFNPMFSNETIAFGGSTPSVSANGNTNGIVWNIDSSAFRQGGSAKLLAHDATNVQTTLYNSANVYNDNAGAAVQFSVPTIANGKVYVAGAGQLSIYGLPSSFTLSPSPDSVNVTVGQSATTSISVVPQNGFTGAVTLSVTGSPAGMTATVGAISGAAATLTVAATTALAPAPYTLTITGSSGSLSASTTVTVVVAAAPPVTLSASPASINLNAGQSGTSNISTVPANGFNAAVTFGVTGAPSGMTASVGALSGGVATLTVATTTAVPAASYTLTIAGTSGSLTASTSVTVVVAAAPSFSLSATPASLSVAAGQSGSVSITVAPSNGFNGTVTFSLTGAPSGVTYAFTPTNSATASAVAISVASTITAGTYPLTVTGTSGSITTTTPISLMVSAPQTITFGAIATQIVGTPLILAATASSTLPVSYTSTTTAVCTLSTSTATFLAPGICSITASQTGSATYAAAAPVTQTFSVIGPQTVTFAPITAQSVGTPLTLTATASSGLAVSYSSVTISVCTVSGNSVTFLAQGTCSITASQSGNSTYAAATPVTQSFAVLAAQSITFAAIAPQAIGMPLTLTATASSGLSVSYSSSTTSVCTVSSGIATFIAGGTCSIIASQTGNSIYAAATPVTQGFSVIGPQTITFAVITPQNPGTTLTLTAAASSGLPVSYSSSTISVCTVSGSTATFLTAGACSITASQAGNSTIAAATLVTQTFYVLTAQSITFAAIAPQTIGTPLTLTATASSGLSVSYSSSTTSVCTVSSGIATFIAGGTCSIIASQTGNSIYAAATPATQSFSVNGPQTITFGVIATQTIGTPLVLSAASSSGLPVSYSSTTAAVCTVSNGIATFIAGGTCSIIASQAGNSTIAAATPVTQTFSVLTAQAITFAAIAPQTVGTPLTLAAIASSGLPVGYSSSTTSVCTVSSGIATLVAGGTCSITASQTGNTIYSAATPISQSFNVTGPQTITFGTIAPQTSGTTLTMTATASSGLSVSYSSSTNTVCTVSGSTVTFLRAGTCSITASQTGNSTFAAAVPVIQSFNVLGVQTITFGAIANQPLATPLTLTATATSGLAVTYSTSTNSVCLVSGSTVTFLAGGTCSLTASQTGNSTYAAATPVTQSFTVVAGNVPYVGYIASWGINNTGATVTWSTDVPATTQLAYGTSTTSLSSLSPLQSSLIVSHGVVLSTLNPGTTYYFVAQSTSASGVTGYSAVMSFTTTGTPTTPAPVISNVLVGSISNSSAVVTWITDEPSSSQVNYGATSAYGSSSLLDSTLVTSHSVTVTALTPGTTYNFDVASVNSYNQLIASGNSTFTTTGTPPAPVISNVATSGLTATSTTITWTTDQATSSLVNYGTSTTYGSSSTLNTTLVTSHSVTLIGLTTGTTYDFDVVSASAGNVSVTSANSTFTTPVASGPAPYVGYVAAWGINNTGVTVTWSSDVPATTQLAYGTSMTSLGSLSPLQSSLGVSHGVVLSTLSPGTTYYFVAQSTGANGVTGASSVYSFTTTGTSTTPPPAITSVTSATITNTSAVISWTTDEPSSSQVNYGETTGYGLFSPLNATLVTGHSVTLTGLTPGTTYNFDVVSANSADPSSSSSNSTFTTTGTPPAPMISNVATSGLTSTSVTITWTTDQATSSLVNYGSTTSYGAHSTVNTSLVTSHSVTLTGLTAGATYDFDVVSTSAGNVSTTSTNSTFTTPLSTGPAPYVAYVAAWGINNTGVTVTWSTDVAATTQLAYGTSTTSLTSLSPLQSSLVVSHGVVLTTLNPGTTYYFVAQSTGADGVTGYSAVMTFSTSGTSTTPPPTITSVTSASITNSSAVITWTTDEPSSSQVNFGATTTYGSSSPLDTNLVTSHSVTLTSLAPGTGYNFDVVSVNSTGLSSTSANSAFTTTGMAAAPMISNVGTSGLTGATVTITWTTDQATSSLVNYGTTTTYGSSSAVNTSLVTGHSVTLTGLVPGTTYDFDVVSTNVGNVSATSTNSTFITPTATGAGPYVGYVAAWGISNTGVTVTWSTDVPANTELAFGTTSALGSFSPLQPALALNHGVALTGLSPGTTYYYSAQSTSAGGVTGSSTIASFTTTGTATLTISNLIVTPATGNVATISWMTSTPTYSYVQFGSSAGNYKRFSTQTALTGSPQITLAYVPSGTVHYQLVSADAYGNQVVSPDATFNEP